MAFDESLQGFAERVHRGRLDRGWSKEQAAREARISSITWKRIEDALPVRDVSRRRVEQLLGIGVNGRDEEVIADEATLALVNDILEPELADYTDKELMRELEGRLLLRALQTGDPGSVTVSVDAEGHRELVSRLPARRGKRR